MGLGTGLAGSALAFALVQYGFDRHREAESERHQQIDLHLRLVRSASPEIAGGAIAALQALGAVDVLVGRYLSHACFDGLDLRDLDLTGARLKDVSLREADLRRAVFTGSTVATSRLTHAASLQHATMRDGRRYDGRLRLLGDLERAQRRGLDTDDAQQMSDFYGVDLAEYEDGQSWADEHLDRLRSLQGRQAVAWWQPLQS